MDTGAIYRTVGLAGERAGVNCSEFAAMQALLPTLRIELVYDAAGEQRMLLNGEDVSDTIRLPEVSLLASRVSALPVVRAFLLDMQRSLARTQSVVMDGRDIGTVVFPDAELKLFMTADPKVRAVRRYEELRARGDDVSLEEIERNIRARDRADQEREVSPLRMAPDAVVLNNSDMTLAQQMEWIEPILEEKIRGI